MGMKLSEAVSILSEFEHRGTDTWILSKSTTYYRGSSVDKSLIVVPAPGDDGRIASSLTPFEALAIASSYKRNEFQQAMEDDVRMG